jgi:hypothetical protein
MTKTGTINHNEIAHLAHQAWMRDGCPHGRDLNYWLEAESQLKATKHLLLTEGEVKGSSKRRISKARAVTKKVRGDLSDSN